MPDSRTILPVDDDANDALFAQKALRKVGITQTIVHDVRDGEEAMQYLSGQPPFDNPVNPPPPFSSCWT